MQPSVAVIIPTYNMARYLPEAISSVRNQNVNNIKIHVVDDGSTDGTQRVLAGLSGPDLDVITTDHVGVARARNAALDRADCRYLAFLDADDRWIPGKLSREIAILEAEPDLGLTFSNFVRFNDDGGFLPDQFSFMPELSNLPTRRTLAGSGYRVLAPIFSTFVLFKQIFAFTPAMLFRRSIVGGIRFRYPAELSLDNAEYLEDLDFCLRIFRKAPVAYITEPLLEVRRHGENLSKNYHKLALAKLRTLQTLRKENLLPAEEEALQNAVARQWVGVGRYYARNGNLLKAWSAYVHGARMGNIRSALLGVARMPWDLLKY